MSTMREGTKKAKTTIEPRVISWEERKSLADKEAEVLEKQIEDLKTWTNMVDAMNAEQLKEYLKNRPDELMTLKIHKSNSKQRIQRENPKCSTSNGIMASVWKFHKEEAEHEKQKHLSEF